MADALTLPVGKLRGAEFDLYAPPDRVFAAFAREPYAAFLDTSATGDGAGLYSYIAFRPRLVIRATGRHVEVIHDGRTTATVEDPLLALRRVIAAASVRRAPGFPGMIGGLIGYLGYELGGQIEKLPMTREDDLRAPDLYFALYDTIFAYDHLRASWRITSFAPEGLAAKHRELLEELMLHEHGQDGGSAATVGAPAAHAAPRIVSNFTRAEYLRAVRRAKRHIRDGDVYQVNLSQRFTADLPCAPWDLYRRLRRLNPAPYSCYLKFPELVLASSSPELFLRVRGREVETRPIKGTRPRGRTRDEDRRLRAELAASEKDRAELSMIVDLERNDLGRACEYGTVAVKDHARIEEYATVFHTVSTVVGRLAKGRDVVDLLRATFPGGSITGCPKIRAMEIIDALEPTARGPYTGSIGYLSADGNVDLNIAIRTFVVKGRHVSYQVGGGIVADSDPAAEYRETLDKGKALMLALCEAEGTE
jgi:para-aminobenzoate synthetase component 1